ncbi:MAG: DUF2213 domain-containing protein [Methylobacterium sp.]|uniref:DUF2213 domain-containing protein n=1 Tax=Methylobacterium sp. TaxID=409 RepID=UPI0025DC349F|nr:DUF2213 domain-containing protein [Methylobacterium sp.]MBX9934538.1 DUF2213 domain-containing protein [Methylobacterium sp.]
MIFTDTLAVERTRRTADGYLVADARAARTGIQVYSGAECGKPELDRVRMHRPADEVFDKASLATYAHKPVTNGHPNTPVTADTYRSVAVGHIDGSVARDGEFVRIPLMVADAAAIADVDAGRAELSAGYQCIVDWTPGVTDAGEPYDAVQRKIRINHVALVDRGRAGSECRIGDDAKPTPPRLPEAIMTTTQKIILDGISLEVSDTAAQVIAKVSKQLADAVADALTKDAALSAKTGEIAALQAAHATALSAKDGEIAALTASIPSGAALDALAAARANLIGQAKTVLGDAFAPVGKTDAEIRRAVVEKAIGDSAKGLDDAGIGGAFAVVVAGKTGNDPLRAALGTVTVGDAGDERKTAHAQMLADNANAWKAAA